MQTQGSGTGGHRARRTTVAGRISRAPETARFLRRAAPAFFREISREYRRESEPAPHRPEPLLWPDTGLHAAWLGHSTVLIKVDGLTLITDPVFSSRVGLGIGPVTLGIKRLVEVALPVAELPPIQLVLLSHAHMDHFDLPSLRALEHRDTQIVTAEATAGLLRRRRFGSVHELRWEDVVKVAGATVRAFEVAHWGARMRSDLYRGYNGYLLEFNNRRILFAGDTAYINRFHQLRRFGPIDLAIMPIGAYDPWIRVHCTPEQAWQMAAEAGAAYVLPVHHQTFKLGREEQYEPIDRLMAAAGSEAGKIVLREIGQEFHLA